jgi:hypothetical protein
MYSEKELEDAILINLQAFIKEMGNDFAFLLDVVGGQEIRTITPLCPAHNHLIKLGPDDDNFDVVMEHVSNALKQLNMPTDISQQVLAIAESAREDVLARGTELLREAA